VQIYTCPQDLATVIGMPLASAPGEKPSFDTEADWGYALRDAGCEGGMGRTRWLLTFATPTPDCDNGHLIAYEISANNERTGRCALLRSPWTREQDWEQLHRINASPAWTPTASNGEASIVEIDQILAGQRLA